MYDLWYSLGVAVMDPSLITAIDAVPPVFTRVTRVIKEGTTFDYKNSITAGLLQKDPTVAVRKAISKHIQQNPAAPPVSIYTAGRWSQLLTVNNTFRHYLQTGNIAYINALGTTVPNFSPSFPAVIGVCLLDQQFSVRFLGDPADPDFVEALDEFDIHSSPSSPELKTISAFVQDPAFATEQNAILTDAQGEWASLCGDQFDFWTGRNERAVV